MSLTFTRRYLDADGQYGAFKRFVEFRAKLVAWDRGAALEGIALNSADGAAWTALFSAPAADIGVCCEHDGNGISVYKKHLFISLYRSNSTEPKIIEYNPSGGAVTNHLLNPLAGGQPNYMGADSIVWNRKLWVITDATGFVAPASRRVVYYYGGASWTAITNYDGAAYLDYNHGVPAGNPGLRIRHRISRLFVFNGELYLLATRYDSVGLKWAWGVWKFDAANYNQFNLIYDSSALGDNFILSAVLENTLENRAYVVGSEVDSSGNQTSIAKLYSSSDMLTWTEESTFDEFLDEFDDAARDPRWTDEANNGTITEAGGLLTLAVANGVNGDFWGATKNAPIVTIDTAERHVVAVAKLNSFVVNDCVRAGLYITDTVNGNNGIIFTRMQNVGSGKNGLQVNDMGVGELAYAAVTALPIWLRIIASGSGAGSVMQFDYSADGITWTALYTHSNETWGKIGLTAFNWNLFKAISAPFEFFHVYKTPGFPWGEKFFEGRVYLNCHDVLTNETRILYWNELDSEFTEEAGITTNPSVVGAGGLESFGLGLYAGKYREIYGAPGTERDQARAKGQSLIVMEMDWKNKLGQITTKRLAPIDVRAPTRFYEGRVLDHSSLPVGFDDMTGLFENSSFGANLSNSDKEYSKLATTYSAKNQMMKLYHLWANEPERFRQHIITMITEDYGIKGAEFNVKFKDITEKYFKIKVPTEICTEDYFTGIHPDHKGRAMPEILGFASLTAGENLGAVEAVYINTASFYYLAAARGLNSIPQVYSDNVLVNPANYQLWGVITGGAGPSVDGRTYIDFFADQGNKKITFNATGYPYGAWNSPAGYVQNPAYITAHFLRFIMGVPFSFINMDVLDSLADIFDRLGAGTSGKLILQDQDNADEVFRQLLFNGAKGFVAKDGRLKADRKDISNYATNLYLFDQIELLDPPDRDFGLARAVNKINAVWDLIPYLNLFRSSQTERKENYFDSDMERDVERRREIPQPV